MTDHRPRALVTRGLTKRYGRATVVDCVDLDVRAGDRYGFLGPNGSGKTTTVRMVLGLVHPTAGEIELLGQQMPRHRAQVLPQVGAMVEGPAHYDHLSGRTNLALLDASGPPAAGSGGRRSRRARVDEVLEQVGLAGAGRKPVGAYSLGMRARLALAGALLRRPRLLVLDEPTNGLDPQGIREVRDLLVALNEAGTTVFLSSHLLAEVEALCTRVGIVDGGRLVEQGDLAELCRPTGRVVVQVDRPDLAVPLLGASVEGRRLGGLVVRSDDPAGLNARLVGHGLRVAGLAPERRTLEDVVLEVTGAGSDRVDGLPPRAGAGVPAGATGSGGGERGEGAA